MTPEQIKDLILTTLDSEIADLEKQILEASKAFNFEASKASCEDLLCIERVKAKLVEVLSEINEESSIETIAARGKTLTEIRRKVSEILKDCYPPSGLYVLDDMRLTVDQIANFIYHKPILEYDKWINKVNEQNVPKLRSIDAPQPEKRLSLRSQKRLTQLYKELTHLLKDMEIELV